MNGCDERSRPIASADQKELKTKATSKSRSDRDTATAGNPRDTNNSSVLSKVTALVGHVTSRTSSESSSKKTGKPRRDGTSKTQFSERHSLSRQSESASPAVKKPRTSPLNQQSRHSFHGHRGTSKPNQRAGSTDKRGRGGHAGFVGNGITRTLTTDVAAWDQIPSEQNKLRDTISKLNKQLAEKDELVQSLVEQQLKRQSTVAETEADDHSRMTSGNSDQSKQEICHLQLELGKLQLACENHAFELSEREEEIRVLKEKCENKHQRILSLGRRTSELGEQAKKFEIDYRSEAEQNQLLRYENERLKHQLDTECTIEAADSPNCADQKDESSNHKSVIVTLRVQVKELNEDVVKLRQHTKEQSRQILVYRQQAEISEEMGKQLKSMEFKQHQTEMEQEKLQDDLKTFRAQAQKLQNERKLLDIELEMSKKEALRFLLDKNRLKDEHDKLKGEYSQALKNLERMSELSVQVVDANKTIKNLERQLALTQVQMKQYKEDFKEERRDKESAHNLLADLEVACDEGRKKSNLEQLKEQLSAAMQTNKELHQEMESVKREAVEERETLRHEIQAKSSQVKQYAKEVDRLKQALEAAQNEQSRELRYQRTDSLHQTSENGLVNTVGHPVKSWSQERTLNNKLPSPTHRDEVNLAPSESQVPFVQARTDESDGVVLKCCHDENLYRDETNNCPNPCTCTPIVVKETFTSIQKDFAPAPSTELNPKNPLTSLTQQCPSRYLSGKFAVSVNMQPPPTSSPINMLNHGSHDQLLDQIESTADSIALVEFHDNEGESQTANLLEDSITLFENPLQREVDDEIHQQAAEVIQEVSGRRREAKTDPKRPFDPNLVCPMCKKQFRIGEIQKFRRHVNTCTGTSEQQ